MKSKYLIVLAASGLLACGGGEDADLAEKKAQLAEYRKEADNLNARIEALEKEIAAIEPTAAESERTVLVTTQPVARKDFAHYIDVRGSVESNQNITIAAENPGMIERIPVSEGQSVTKGQLLVQQDSEVIQRNIDELKTQLELATTLYEKQANLWQQRIGTELQYLQAKNNKESLESRLRTLNTQLSKTAVRAPFSGVVDAMLVREGENAMPGTPMVRIVNLNQVYITADVSEEYLGRVKQGDAVLVQFPSLNLEKQGKIRSVSQVIKPDNRTFAIEISISNENNQLRPKMLAVLRIKDFQQEDAVVIPTNLIQREKNQEYVYVIKNTGDASRAVRVPVERGPTYQNETMITGGLSGNEEIIREGFRGVAQSM
jgi:membrane fusion protein, multidrug efflux system